MNKFSINFSLKYFTLIEKRNQFVQGLINMAGGLEQTNFVIEGIKIFLLIHYVHCQSSGKNWGILVYSKFIPNCHILSVVMMAYSSLQQIPRNGKYLWLKLIRDKKTKSLFILIRHVYKNNCFQNILNLNIHKHILVLLFIYIYRCKYISVYVVRQWQIHKWRWVHHYAYINTHSSMTELSRSVLTLRNRQPPQWTWQIGVRTQ